MVDLSAVVFASLLDSAENEKLTMMSIISALVINCYDAYAGAQR